MGLFVALTFGSSYPVAKPLLGVVDPFVFSSSRFLLAGAIMVLVPILWRGWASVAVGGTDFFRLLGLGLIGYTLFHGVWGVGLSLTTPAKAVVIVATTPIFSALISAWAGDRLPLTGWVGVMVSFLGVFVLVNNSLTTLQLSGGAWLGDLLFIIAAALWAVYGAMSRPLVIRLGAWRVTAWCTLLGAIALSPLATAPALEQDWSLLSLGHMAAFLHTSVIVGCLGLAAWGGGLARLGLARISAYLYLSPVCGVALSGVMLGQWLSALQIAGGVVVLGGVALTQWSARRE